MEHIPPSHVRYNYIILIMSYISVTLVWMVMPSKSGSETASYFYCGVMIGMSVAASILRFIWEKENKTYMSWFLRTMTHLSDLERARSECRCSFSSSEDQGSSILLSATPPPYETIAQSLPSYDNV